MPKGPEGREQGIRYEQWRNPKAEEGGIVKITGAFLLDHSEEILNLINREGKLAKERNPKDGISNIEHNKDGITVETADHNLALRIGKALTHAYNGRHDFKFLKGEKFVQVNWRRD